MKFSTPKITIDKAALKKGFWGNTWRNWGYILAAFLILYGIEAGYFTGLLYASKRIRGQAAYRALPTQYFGDFERENIPISFPFPGANSYNPFNRPDACVTVEEPINFPDIGETVNRPTGVQKCTPSKDTLGWVLFPWVADTNAAGNFPGCAAAGGATLLTKETSPAFVGDIAAPPAAACQNFVIKQQAATAGAVAAAPSTGR